MFEYVDFIKMERSYFKILSMNSFHLTVQSKNTKHYWHIISDTAYKSCVIYHKHNTNSRYHYQTRAKNLKKAIEKIKEHDKFQLSGRKLENIDHK